MDTYFKGPCLFVPWIHILRALVCLFHGYIYKKPHDSAIYSVPPFRSAQKPAEGGKAWATLPSGGSSIHTINAYHQKCTYIERETGAPVSSMPTPGGLLVGSSMGGVAHGTPSTRRSRGSQQHLNAWFPPVPKPGWPPTAEATCSSLEMTLAGQHVYQ